MKIGAHLEIDEGRLKEICLRYGVAELAIFGSVTRGDFNSESDIEPLVCFPARHAHWFGHSGLRRRTSQSVWAIS